MTDALALFSTIHLNHPLLDAAAEQDLAVRIEAGLAAQHLHHAGDATSEELAWLIADGHAARETFVAHNLRLAYATARPYLVRGEREDILQDAYYGLTRAVDRFDYRRGNRFSTVAVWWIREAVLRGLRIGAAVRYPEELWNAQQKALAVAGRLEAELGHPVGPATVAAQTGAPTGLVAKALGTRLDVASLDATVGETPGATVGSLTADPFAGAALERVEDQVDVRSAWQSVTRTVQAVLAQGEAEDTDWMVLARRFGLTGGEPAGVDVVARELGLSRDEVRRREMRMLHALRSDTPTADQRLVAA